MLPMNVNFAVETVVRAAGGRDRNQYESDAQFHFDLQS